MLTQDFPEGPELRLCASDEGVQACSLVRALDPIPAWLGQNKTNKTMYTDSMSQVLEKVSNITKG